MNSADDKAYVKVDGRYCPLESSRLDLTSKQWNEYENLWELRKIAYEVGVIKGRLKNAVLIGGGFLLGLAGLLGAHLAS